MFIRSLVTRLTGTDRSKNHDETVRGIKPDKDRWIRLAGAVFGIALAVIIIVGMSYVLMWGMR